MSGSKLLSDHPMIPLGNARLSILSMLTFGALAALWLLETDLRLLEQWFATETAAHLHLLNGWILLTVVMMMLFSFYRQQQNYLQQVRKTQRQFRSTFDQAAVGIAHVSLTGHFLRLNQRFADMLQYDIDQLTHCSFHDITHPDDLADDLLNVDRLMKGQISHYGLEKRYRRQDGSYFWAHLSVSLHQEKNAAESYFISVIEDIDLKKHAQLALQASAAQIQLLLDASDEGILGLSAADELTFVNQTAVDQLGYQSPNQLLGLPLLTIIAKQKSALAVWREMTRLHQQPKTLRGEADLLVSCHGVMIPCAYRVIPVPPAEDGTVLVLCFQNIRARRQQQLRQQAQNHLLQRLADNEPVQVLLTDLVLFVEQQLPQLKCSVLLADLKKQTLHVAAGPSLPAEYNAKVEGLPIRYGIGSCGTAAAIGQPVVVTDVRNDLLWQQVKALIEPYEWLQACWSTPFFSRSKKLLGTFGIYVPEQREPRAEEQDLIQFTASLAAFLIERSEAQTQMDLLSKAVQQSPIAVLLCDADGEITFVNHKFEALTGLSAEAVIGLFLPDIYPAELRADVQNQLQRVQNSTDIASGEYKIVSGNGLFYWQSYCLRRIVDEQQQSSHLLLEIEDVTHQKETEQQLILSEMRFRTLLDKTPEIAVQGYEADGTTFYWNQASEKLYGYSKAEAIGRNLLELIIPIEMRQGVRHAIAQMVATGEAVPSEELFLQHKDGHKIAVHSGHAVVKLPGTPAQIFCMDLDLTERKKQQSHLRLAAEVFNSSREGIMITDINKTIISVNPALQQLLGYSEAELLGQTPAMFSSGLHGSEFYQNLWSMLTQQHYWQGEIINRRKDGSAVPLQLSISAVFDEQQNLSNYAAIFTDLSEIRATRAEMTFLVEHDELTLLPNRQLFLQLLEQTLKTAKREQQSCAVLVMDLDHFKDVNDSYGHHLGDELLLLVAQRLKSQCRDMDVLARLGGDEFALLLTDLASFEDPARVALKLLAALSQPWLLANQFEVQLGVSIGISIYPLHAQSAAELLQGADAALYKAKAAGRNTYTFFSDEFTQSAREKLTLETNLRKAIRQGDLQVYYQPQLDIHSGQIIGAEALVRWFDAELGMISPARFIPVAEACGLINDIGQFVLEETCRQGQRWLQLALPKITLAVNVSPVQFKRFDMKKLVLETLAKTGYPAHALELELTESALMENEEIVISTLNQLRDLGIRLAIDDFGTGYSSLAYLKRFPLDVLKIDKQFIDDIPHNKDDMEIATTIIGIAHTLGFKVLAEGVETTAQLAFLTRQRCDFYQGYYCSPPVPAAAFEQLLRQQQNNVQNKSDEANTAMPVPVDG